MADIKKLIIDKHYLRSLLVHVYSKSKSVSIDEDF